MKLISMSLCLVLLIYGLASADITIISNTSVPETSLTRLDIKNIYLGKKIFWDNNSKIRFASLSDGKANKVFLADYINKTPAQYKGYWEKMVFTGDGLAPVYFNSAKKLIEFVSVTEGAIGFVDTNEVPLSETVRTIDVSQSRITQ